MSTTPSSHGALDLSVSPGRDILVVDDNEANLVAIEAALDGLGRRLVLARSGTEALARLLDQDFALILLDVAMPGIDGFETASLLRARERSRATPIIFITGIAWHDDSMIRGYNLGAFDYLMKPFRPEVLRAKVQVFVELQERTIALQEAQALAHQRDLEAQRRRIETEAMEREMKTLVEVDRKKDEFLAILAHELRNPIQPLLSTIEMIEAAPDRPVPERMRQILRRHIHHVNRLVDDLLDVARFTSRKLDLRREIVAIDAMIDQAVTQSRGLLERRMHEVIVRHAGERARVNGDPVRLVQVLCNLITNAGRYTPPNGRIEIVAGVEREEVTVRVIDNGQGISAEVLPRVFDMFVQERASMDGGGGLGLGLGLVKRLVELHGGNVIGMSEGEGRGSMFEIRLPLATELLRQLDGNRPPEHRDEMPLRVLVCEDAADVRELIADMLRSRGHLVTLAGDGAAALRAMLEERPDVALIDIGLPGMTGYDVARAIRRDLPAPPRLVAITGYGQPVDRAKAFEAGFDAHVTKPASADQILSALRA